MSLSPGIRLGPYEIVAPLGAGGMGEVYRARDTRLGREVAVKVLPGHLKEDAELRARFEREARTVSSLNHPHICVLHDIGSQDGTDYIVMELVEGETLLDRLKRVPLPLGQTLRYGIEIADALDKAHRHGVIHRDLKPGNVMLTKAGSKLMDFGLAKRALAGDGSGGVSALPTQEMPLTEAGSLLGTFQYMAPEQLEGKEADARADIWALGCVLYEMVTGKRAFEGKSQASLISAIMTSEPQPIAQLQPMSPPALDRLVKTCLAKDPDERWQSAHDVVAELRWIAETGTAVSKAGATRRHPWRAALTHALTATAAALVTGLLLWRLMASSTIPRSGPEIRSTIRLPEGQRMSHMMYPALALSPDARLLAYVAQEKTGRRLHLRSLDRLHSMPVPGTEDAWTPFFSPDGQWLGFAAGGKIKKVSVSGGAPLTVASAPEAVGASWGEDGKIVFAPTSTGGLWRVSADGGVPEQLTKPDFAAAGNGHAWPRHLPGSTKILFQRWGDPKNSGLAVLDTATRQWRLVLPNAYGGLYSRTGHLLFMTDDSGHGLFAQQFDIASTSVSGSPVSVADAVSPAISVQHLHAALSDTGTLVYLKDVGEAQSLLWLDRQGRIEAVSRREGGFMTPRLSPDGRRVAFFDEGLAAIWSLDLARRTERLVTRANGYNCNPVWTDDGAHIAFCSNPSGNWDLYEMSGDGGERRPLLARTYDQCPESWSRSPEGPLLVYNEWHPTTGPDLWILPADGKPVAIAATPAREAGAALSPDGRYVAYVSDESGRDQVYLRNLKTTQTLSVSSDGGTEPLWSRDGRELFFRSGDRLMVVGAVAGPELHLTPPKLVFELPFEHYFYEPVANYDISADGRRFLVPSDTATTEIQLVLNWASGLKQPAAR